ncbi:VIT-domain-containing protein [Lentithecium fluviatile CBS 122367]|uniref:VIT-domain-containing protein n=1 Tax=Lentithecium fluviatile CBS 122367 TaxID=1168545 RepID=A0A6G1IMN2_9PLEO|nr:VIT-domain-containing protein [Lentithecium fluviatile CBS 122367]
MRTKMLPYGSPGRHVCGCYVYNPEGRERTYLPQVKLDAHTTILSTASRTVLKQTFVNSKDKLDEIRYAFPLFDGVSVVEFVCRIGDRTIYGLVKEKGEARKTYEEAKERGESAALLEQLPEAADVFTTSLGNIPERSSIDVTITYVQELKHDAEVDGVRLTMPTSISPRYGTYPGHLQDLSAVNDSKGISLTIDVSMAEGIPIKKVISPSHPIEVSLGLLSTSATDGDPSVSKASATLALGTTELEKDFVLQVVAKDVGIPQAILETHKTLPNQRALMTTLVPKFSLKSQKPEIIFIADRSGSMDGHIPTLVSALKVFLKSIPVGCTFNICSFGSRYSFLWPKSQVYGQDTLNEAIKHVEKFGSNFGGTETLQAVKACCETRHKELPTELMLLTDGDIWSQQQMFDYISEETKSGDVRVFPIGIGSGVSSALIEGVARAGRGFAQMVADNEKLDSKIVRMLKGALTPHIKDYRLEVKYEDESVESVADSLRVNLNITDDHEKKQDSVAPADSKPISLYDPNAKEEHPKADDPKDIFAGLPKLDRPKLLQTPHEIPPLFPFNRTCVYLLMGPDASQLKPKSVVLKGTSPQGPLELEIPVEVRKQPDEMVHQLAARKATQDLEEGRGWVSEAKVNSNGILVKDKYPAQFALLQRREAVRIGVEFQVGGKYCSFVAVEANEAEIAAQRKKALETTIQRNAAEDDEDWEMPEAELPPAYQRSAASSTEAWRQRQLPGGPALQRGMTRKVKLTQGMSEVAAHGGGRAAQLDSAIQSSRRSSSQVPLRSMLSAPSDLAAKISGSGLFTSFRNKFLSPEKKGSTIRVEANMPTPSTGAGLAGAPPPRFLSVESCEAAEEDKDMGFGPFDDGAAEQFSAPKIQASTPETGSLVQRLINRQTFEGAWANFNDLLCKETKIDRDAAVSAVDKFVDAFKESLDKIKAEQILCTALVVLFFEKKLEDEQETWELVVEKARAWLDENVAEDVRTEAWKLAEVVICA